jgi:hypothetical protein
VSDVLHAQTITRIKVSSFGSGLIEEVYTSRQAPARTKWKLL